MIIREERDGVRVLRLAHGKVSAMDIELGEAIIAELAAAAAPNVRAIVITGTGSAFSAGVDLFRLLADGPTYVRRFLPMLDVMLRSMLEFQRPIVAAINGHAIAGGCILAACCDHRIMAAGAGRIGIPELAVGVPFPVLPLQIMAARLADPVLRDLVFSGRTVQVDEALAMGLIDEKCDADSLLERAIGAARSLAAISTPAFALTKASFTSPILDRASRLAELNARVHDAWLLPGTQASIQAYLDKTLAPKVDATKPR